MTPDTDNDVIMQILDVLEKTCVKVERVERRLHAFIGGVVGGAVGWMVTELWMFTELWARWR